MNVAIGKVCIEQDFLIENKGKFPHGRQHIHSWGRRSSSGGRKEKEEEGPDASMLFENASTYLCQIDILLMAGNPAPVDG